MSVKFNEMIRQELERRNLSESAGSVRAGLSRSTLFYILKNPNHQPESETVKKISQFFGFDEDLALELTGHRTKRGEPEAPIPFNELLRRAELAAPVAIPVVDQILHAGVGVTPIDYVYLPAFQARGKRLAGAAVHGDCMEPEIKDGDQVIVDFDASPNPGDVVVALVNGEEVQLRRFKARTNSHVILTCNNPAYKDCEVEDVRVIGVVIQATKILRR